MSDLPISGDDADLRAAEHVLGLLDGGEAAAAISLVASDAAFAARVAAWEARLAPLLETDDVAPPPGLWSTIDARIPANDAAVPNKAGPWRTIAALATAIAAVLLVTLLIRPAQVAAPVAVPTIVAAEPALIATLSGEAGATAMTVSYDRTANRLLINPVGLKLAGRVPELWVIPADGKARSLGVVRAEGPSRALVAAERRAFLVPGATLAISLEPPGGSPTGTATGPIVMTGKISRV